VCSYLCLPVGLSVSNKLVLKQRIKNGGHKKEHFKVDKGIKLINH
jgi:hypothetical protein